MASVYYESGTVWNKDKKSNFHLQGKVVGRVGRWHEKTRPW